MHGLDLAQPDYDLTAFDIVDLGNPDSINAAADRLGNRVDALFNCAGTSPMSPPVEIVRVNFAGLRLLTERVVSLMDAGGAVVSTSSDGGYAWRKNLPLLLEFLDAPGFDGAAAWYEQHQHLAGHAYPFSKQALTVWTMQQAAALIGRGIRINAVSPGAVQTPILAAIEGVFPRDMIAAVEQPIGRRSLPAEQVGPLLFLNSEQASYVNGVDLPVDGGYWSTLSLDAALW